MDNEGCLLSVLVIILLCLFSFLGGNCYSNINFEQRCVDNGVAKRTVDEKGVVRFEFISNDCGKDHKDE